MAQIKGKVIPGDLTVDERSHSHYLIWNTEDDFDSDPKMRGEYGPIMGYHRMKANMESGGHWYLPFADEANRYTAFKTEREAYNRGLVIYRSKLN
jgi:hypothetical protein